MLSAENATKAYKRDTCELLDMLFFTSTAFCSLSNFASINETCLYERANHETFDVSTSSC